MQKTDKAQTSITDKPLIVPSYSKWRDEDVMKFSPNEFMQALYHRAKNIGDDLYDSDVYKRQTWVQSGLPVHRCPKGFSLLSPHPYP